MQRPSWVFENQKWSHLTQGFGCFQNWNNCIDLWNNKNNIVKNKNLNTEEKYPKEGKVHSSSHFGVPPGSPPCLLEGERVGMALTRGHVLHSFTPHAHSALLGCLG